MRIYIITEESFPFGRAATNRIISYGKGFYYNGIDTKVICLRANNDENQLKLLTEGIFENIPYIYTAGTPFRPNCFLKRRYYFLKAIFKSISLLKKKRLEYNQRIMLLFSNRFILIFFYKIISFILQYKLLQEKSEYPFVLKNKSFIGRFWSFIYMHTVFKQFDGILAETEKLKYFLNYYVSKRTKFLIVPATIDPTLILEERKDTKSEKYIYYCGSLDKKKKDGIPILIRAYHLISQKYPEIKLYISGFANNNEDVEELINLTNSLKLKERIIFTGRITKTELVYFLKNASILALAKEKDEIQSGGMSSKIIEYLYTGNPIVLTRLPDITKHLKDKDTAFLCEPESPESMAATFEYVLEYPEEAKNVGLNGQNYAIRTFDYKVHTKRIKEFVNLLYE